MAYKVLKFGGSNLKNKEDYSKLKSIVTRYNEPLVIVVSAFYGVTDKLIVALDNAVDSKDQVEEFVNSIFEDNVEIIKNNVSSYHLQEEAVKKLFERVRRLKEMLLAIHYIKDIPDFIKDHILSFGERFSSLILNYILTDSEIVNSELLPEEIGLITDGEYSDATIDYERSEQNLRNSIRPGITYIIPGFYGVSLDGKVNLLGRGGTDYSAASVAACLNADSLDIWKDVEGFMSADPAIVREARRVETLTYSEAAELAYFGSKILHPRTPEPLVDKNIPIRIFNIHSKLERIEPLTIINGKSIVSENIIKSVSFSEDFGILKLKGQGVGIKPGILAKVSSKFDQNNINIKSVITSQTAINFLLSQNDLEKAKEIIDELDIHGITDIEALNDITLIAAVGEGLTQYHGIAARIFSAVARKQINIEIISFGASRVAVYFIVDSKKRNLSINQIHQEFFSKNEPDLVERVDCLI